jgi:hypothetical protein
MASSITQSESSVATQNTATSGKTVAYSLVVQLVLNSPLALTAPSQVQGAFVDNSAGTVACVVSTLAGDSKSIPPGSQGTMPLYLGSDNGVTLTGVGAVRITFLTFATPMAVWSAVGSASAVAEGYGPSDAVLFNRVRNTYAAGELTSGSATMFSGGAYLDAFVADLSADATISGGGVLSWAVQPTGGNSTAIVQQTSNTSNSNSVVFSNAPTAGNTILVFGYSNYDAVVSAPSGFTSLGSGQTVGNSNLHCWTYTVQAGDTGTYSGFSCSNNYNLFAFEINTSPSNVVFSQEQNASLSGDVVTVSLPSAPSGNAFRIVLIWDAALLTPGSLSSGLTQVLYQNANIGDVIVTTGGPSLSGNAVFTLGNSPTNAPGSIVIDVKGTAAPAPLFQGNVHVPGTASVSAGRVNLMTLSDMKLTAPSNGGFLIEITGGSLATGGIYWTALGGQSSVS